jgi:predicted RNA methylase
VVRGDFLALSPDELGGPFDGVAMNPPFSLDGQPFADVEHVTHAVAFAKRGAPVVAVMSPGARDRDTAKHRTFRKLVIDRGQGSWRDVPAGTFKHAGTNIATVILATRA